MLVYLVRLADVLDIDIAAAARAKIEDSAGRYPADEHRGEAPAKS